MNKIIDTWSDTLFMQPFFEILMAATFVYTIRKRNNIISLKIFPFYLGAFLVFRVTIYCFLLFSAGEEGFHFRVVNAAMSYAVSFIEFVTFFWFIYHEVRIMKFKNPIWLLGAIGAMWYLFRIALIYPELNKTGMYLVHNIYFIESIVILVSGFFYMAGLFLEPQQYELKKMPAFWIYCGIMVCLIASLPIRIISNYFYVTDMNAYRVFFAGIYSAYIVLLAMILKGYHCLSHNYLIYKPKSYEI